MELTREVLEDMAECDNRSCTCCKGGCEDWGHGISSLTKALLAEMDKPKVWDGSPERATCAMVVWYGSDGFVDHSEDYTRKPPKSRIDEIAEEAASKWAGGKKALEDAIKSAILKDSEEREANR